MRTRRAPVAVLTLVLAGTFAGCVAEPPVGAGPRTSPPPSADEQETTERPVDADLPPLERLPSRLIDLEFGSAPAALTTTPGSVWVQAHRTPALTRLDAETGEITAEIDTGRHLGCGDLLTAAGSVWFAGCEVSPGLLRVDPVTGEVTETIDADGLGPAELDGRLWVGDRAGGGIHLKQFDVSETAALAGSFLVPGLLDSEGGIGVAQGALWTADKDGAIAYRVDPLSGEVLTAVPVPLDPDSGYVITHDDAVWYTDPAQGALVRIDPLTGEVRMLATRTVQPDEYWGVAASSAPDAPGMLWVRSGNDEVWLIDTRSDRVERRILVTDGGGGDVQQVGNDLWVSSFATDQVEIVSLGG